MKKVRSKLAADVERHGFHVLKVFSPDGDSPPFAYTVGLETTFHHPEVTIFGLNADLDFMHRMLNEIGARIAKGERFEHGAKKKNLLAGYVCPFARFPKSAFAEHLGQAIAFRGSSKFRAVQCIWPDTRKHLPWDPKVILPVLSRQPVFLRPDAGPRDPVWPFAEPHSRHVITSRQVATGKEPIRYAGRFDDGDWQFACDTTDNQDDVVIATLGWVFDRDPSVRAAARLRKGQALRRVDPRAPWKRAKDDWA